MNLLTGASLLALAKSIYYSIFKNETNRSEFINHIRNPEHRRVASKFRIGNKNLKIETGRFTIPKTPADLKICDHCNQNSVENELHILFHLDQYNDLRKTLFIKINDRNTYNLHITISMIKSVFFLTILIHISVG